MAGQRGDLRGWGLHTDVSGIGSMHRAAGRQAGALLIARRVEILHTHTHTHTHAHTHHVVRTCTYKQTHTSTHALAHAHKHTAKMEPAAFCSSSMSHPEKKTTPHPAVQPELQIILHCAPSSHPSHPLVRPFNVMHALPCLQPAQALAHAAGSAKPCLSCPPPPNHTNTPTFQAYTQPHATHASHLPLASAPPAEVPRNDHRGRAAAPPITAVAGDLTAKGAQA